MYVCVIHIRKTYGAGELDMIEVDPEKPHSYAYVKLHATASLHSFFKLAKHINVTQRF